jgi:hypothetical protein
MPRRRHGAPEVARASTKRTSWPAERRPARRGRQRPGAASAEPASSAAALLALDAGGLALQLAQVVEARAPHVALRDHLDLLDARRVQREDALDADAVGDLADGERRARATAVLTDHDALEDLDALLVAFLDQTCEHERCPPSESPGCPCAVGALDLTQKRGSAHGNLLSKGPL